MSFDDLCLLNCASDTAFIRGLYGVYGCETEATYFCHHFLDSVLEVFHVN